MRRIRQERRGGAEWTAEEDEFLVREYKAGTTFQEIGRMLNRSYSAIQIRCFNMVKNGELEMRSRPIAKPKLAWREEERTAIGELIALKTAYTKIFNDLAERHGAQGVRQKIYGLMQYREFCRGWQTDEEKETAK